MSCAPFKKKNVITVDMGGTSFDITLTKDGQTNLNKNIDFLRYRIGVPMIQVETLGAGGGSIGWIDSHGILAGRPAIGGLANPGPACYGQGGTRADDIRRQSRARLSQSRWACSAASCRSISTRPARPLKKVADPLGMSVERAAYGMFTIVNNNMVNGIRRVSVERGYDPRDFVLVGAGGATAAHITALAREMGIDTIILPKLASGLCAFGQIISDVKYNYMATAPVRLDNADGLRAHRHAVQRDRSAGREASGSRRLQEAHDRGRSAASTCAMSARCMNARSRSAISRSTTKTIEKVKEAFHKRHEELYTYSEPPQRGRSGEHRVHALRSRRQAASRRR